MQSIRAFCERWKITEFSLFGSVLRKEFSSSSDVDVLVSFANDAHWTLFDFASMRDELKGVFGREVDLVSRRGIESSRNVHRRQSILESAERIYRNVIPAT
ncbi:MAG: nucleotidyltransferase domain-containing protein [Magnetococcales bacterium]|nr:nucleotidyltransferase domain-containing protein [Magnetococcales bacterium]MBF0149650.1 nucleotidyltransferase domain-containing protein [Magnetococcales bacterium]MBF0348538.1 nucleotidyltransferase domain-containing protein [Magnetococcales bacterium]